MAENQKRILIIDDDADIAELLTYHLRKSGYETVIASSGVQALWRLAENFHPDLILLDLMLPGTDGFELCHYLSTAAEWREIPILVLSAKGSLEDIERAIALGAQAYFVKASFSLADLKGMIRKILEESHRHLLPPGEARLLVFNGQRPLIFT